MWTSIRERTGQMDGSSERLPAKVHKSLFCAPSPLPLPVARPHILTRAPPIFGRAALYTLHNDVYPVSTTGTIVPKVNI